MASAVVGTLRVLLEVNAANLEREFDKATVKVGNFDKFTVNAGRNLNRMVESFSGQKIVAEAVRMASALEHVGGVSTLTEKELGRVASTVAEATAKLRAMGAEVPPSIAKLSTELKTLGHGAQTSGGFLSGLGSMASKLGPLLPIASVTGAATALLRMGSAALESADQIVKLSDKTGISTDEIQRMQYVAGQTGTTVEALAASAFKGSINIATGGKQAREAIDDLGLSFQAVKNLKPEDQFNTVIRALEGVEDVTERNRLGVAIYGRQFSEMAASVSAGYTRIRDEASVVAEAQVRAAEAAGDAWERFKDRLSKISIGIVGRLAQELTDEAAAVDSLTQHQVEHYRMLLKTGGDAYGYLITLARERADAEKKTTDAVRDSTRAQEDWAGRVLAAQEELNDLTTAKRNAIDAAKRLGATTEMLIDQFGLSEDALRLYGATADKTTTSSGRLSTSTKTLGTDAMRTAAELKKFNDQLREFNKLSTSLHDAVSRGWFGPIETELKDVTSLLSRTLTEAGKLNTEMERWAQSVGAVYAPAMRGYSGALNIVNKETEGATVSTATWREGLGTLAQALSQLAQVSGESFSEVARWLATVVGAMDVANKSAIQFSKGLDTFKGGERAAGFAQMAAGALSLVAALHQATAATNKFQGALAGVMAMAGTGNPWLMLAGGVYGYIRGLQNAQEAQRLLGVQFRKDLGALRAEAQNVMQQAWVLGLDDDLQQMLATAETQADLERIAELIGIIQNNYGQLQDEAGGIFDDLMRLAEDAGGIPDSMRDLVEHFRSLGILTDEQEEKLRTLGDSGVVSLDKMTAAADVIKARFESLGPAFNQQRLDRDAMKVVNALDTLIKGSADVGGVLFDAREEISELVRESFKFGTTVPANMKPWIDHLFETGNLLDENGDKITDISKIKYGEPLKTEAEKITEAFKTMTQKLLDFFDRLGQEILRIPDRRIKVGVDYDDSGLPPNLRGGDDDESGTFSPSRGAFSAIGPAFDLSGLAPVPMGAVRGAFSAGASPSMALADTRSSGADGSQSMLRAIGEFMDRRDPLFLIAVRDAARGAV